MTNTITATPGTQEPPTPPAVSLDQASVTRLLDLVRETVEATLTMGLARLREPATPSALPPTASSKSTGLDLNASEKLKAADLPLMLLTGKSPRTLA